MFKLRRSLWACGFVFLLAAGGCKPGRAEKIPVGRPGLEIPQIGDQTLTVVTPEILEVTLITTKRSKDEPVRDWNFVGADGELKLPKAEDFYVSVDGREVKIGEMGFKRRVRYAPLRERDMRIGSHMYLVLEGKVAEGATVRVEYAGEKIYLFESEAEAGRWSPVLHVNQFGYGLDLPKLAMAGFYMGSLGELKLEENLPVQVVRVKDGSVAWEGRMRRRPDVGFTFPTYQEVWEADFSDLSEEGEFVLEVPGLGRSYPFLVGEGNAGGAARAYALGLYHQRCGTANELPYTRFVHEACHMRPAEVPVGEFKAVNEFLADMTGNVEKDEAHQAPRLDRVEASLYPFVKEGSVDVSGGHHDAGDYSKYTINSALLIHHLLLAADAFPGVRGLDNLGIPESGNGVGDLLDEARWEVEFLVKMQDEDGGFYFLVYPRERKYEDDVLPDAGDPQVVFPKTTAVTAAAAAVLAQASSSSGFREAFPELAEACLGAAERGWVFLEKALREHGERGAYQQITHYGAEFQHRDELAWAATELFLATGEQRYHEYLKENFDPADPGTRRWTWWRLYEGYGCAIRSYAFAEATGRRKSGELDAAHWEKCREEVLAAAQDQIRFAEQSAYGTSFPDPTKRFRTAGWYFSSDRAFDIVAGMALAGEKWQGEGRALAAAASNLNYELGANPVNVSYLTGMGWKQPRDIVHQYAQNDRRALPPSGIPIGNIQAGFQFLHHYERELGQVSYPPDGAEEDPYPFYDRWGDSFNTTTEFVVVNQGRALATAGYLMARSEVRDQAWNGVPARIVTEEGLAERVVLCRVEAEGLSLENARVVWEGEEIGPQMTPVLRLDAGEWKRAKWLEAEVVLRDGRRVFAVVEK